MRKKRRGLVIIFLILLIGSCTYFFWLLRIAKKPARWSNFGIELPGNYAIHGIDVSRYQDHVYWTHVQKMRVGATRIRFAFIKATEGTDLIDKQFDANWERCRDCQLWRGAYHFFHPSMDAEEQAIFFIRNVNLKPGDMPPVLDVETSEQVDPDLIRGRVCDWLLMVEKHYRIRPVIYTNISFYRQYLQGYFDDYPLWIAHYGAPQPNIDRDWTFWQHSDRGRVNGIDNFVDFNTFNGDSLAFTKLLLPEKRN